MLRKAVDLDIDLRKVFLEADKDDLTVINRAKFKTIVLDLPLGITEAEFEEIAENDFNYDNSGNVDYKVILNSDLFVSLERKRVLRSYKKRRGVRINNSVDDNDVQ
jgi:Ca2+-binding EF-hand superfamily protein